MQPTGSLVFDRAVDFYDKTRSLSSATMSELVTLLREQLGTGPCLEIGVGTGRIALPLLESGTDLVGLDLSQPMMRRLVDNAGGRRPCPLVAGDATSLPFTDHAFNGALAVHVLHLIPGWRVAARELLRVVRPGGSLVIDIGRQTQGPFRDLLAAFTAAARIPDTHRGVNDADELDAVMTEAGAALRKSDVMIEKRSATYTKTIDSLEAGTYSITWSADEATRKTAAEHTRRWAEQRYGELDQPYEYHLEISLRGYRLPS
ncbi:MAG: class I SAM-dependent methyltransferase [Actinomycetota bacterium]